MHPQRMWRDEEDGSKPMNCLWMNIHSNQPAIYIYIYIIYLYIYIYICIRPYSEGMISILCSYIWLQLKMQGPDLYPGRTGDPYPWSIPFWRDRIHLRSCAQLLRSIRTDHCVAIYTLVLSHPTLGWLNEREHNFGWMDDSLENPDVR